MDNKNGVLEGPSTSIFSFTKMRLKLENDSNLVIRNPFPRLDETNLRTCPHQNKLAVLV